MKGINYFQILGSGINIFTTESEQIQLIIGGLKCVQYSQIFTIYSQWTGGIFFFHFHQSLLSCFSNDLKDKLGVHISKDLSHLEFTLVYVSRHMCESENILQTVPVA